MQGKNKSISPPMKKQIEVQTNINLVQNQQLYERSSREKEDYVRLSQVLSSSNLLRSFSNKHMFHELNQMVQQLKTSDSRDISYEKRISLIEKQLQGLIRRNLLIQKGNNQDDNSNDYYSILCQKDRQFTELEYKLAFNDKKIYRYEHQIKALQREIQTLHKSLQLTNSVIIQNEIYRQFVSSIKKDKQIDVRKFVDLENKLKPKIKQGSNSQSKQTSEVSTLFKYFSGQLQKLKNTGFTVERLNDVIIAFYQFNNSQLNTNQFASNFSYKAKYESLQEKYGNLNSVFKKEIEKFQTDNPSLKGMKKLENLISLTSQSQAQTQLINISDWIGIGKIQNIVISENQSKSEQIKTNHLLISIVKSLKLLTQKYPRILLDIPEQIKFLLEQKDFVSEMVESESVLRLKQIVSYKPDIIRVDNIYNYNNQKEQSLIFNLRVLIKSLLQQLQKIKSQNKIQITLDEAILQMLKEQVIQGLDIDSILKLYRPLPKIVEVERIVERPVYINGTLQKTIPIQTEKMILAQAITEKAVEVIREVPIYIQKLVNNKVTEYVEVVMQTEKLVEVPTIRQVVVERLLTNQQLVQVEVQRIVNLYEQKIVQVEKIKQVVMEVPTIVQVEKQIELPVQKQYIEVQKIVEKPVYLRQVKQRIKQIQITNEKLFEHDRYIQIQKKVPHIIVNKQIVYLDRQVPRFITNTEEKEIHIKQTIDRIVPYKVLEQKILEVPVIVEKQVIKQIEKEVFVQNTHFIKGDREQIIKQVEIIVEKPYREEVLITRDLQIQKVVPLYIKEQKPIYIEMHTPYVQTEAKIISQDVCKIVPLREQVVKQIRVQVQVPVIVEKQVIRTETVYIDRIVQKMVEVPRIVEIQKIVQKIVPIPRIIEKIVEVIKIVQKIVVVEVPCLQIVQIIREIPVIKEVQVIKQVVVEKQLIEIIKEIQLAERDRIVQILIEKEIPRQIQVERRIPVQLIRQIPVHYFRDRIIEKLIEIHEVTVKDREVIVPFKHQIPVEFTVEKAVAIEKIIETIVKVPQIIERQVPITNTVTIPQIVQVQIEKAIQIQVVKEIPGPETIKYIQVPRQIELLRQKIVQVENTIQIPKEVYLYMDKIVHQYHERYHPIEVQKMIQKPVLFQVSKPLHFIHYKQIPVQIQTNKNVPIRTVVSQIQQVVKQVHHQNTLEVYRERLKQIINETKLVIEKQVEKELIREVVVNQTKIQQIQVQSQPKIVQLVEKTVQIRQNPNYIERIVERIVMLPQIVEVVKHIHQITQVQSLGVAKDTNIQEHTKQFGTVSSELKLSLIELRDKLKQNSNLQPDLKNMIAVIQKHLKMIQSWIQFPKLIQLPVIVQKLVQVPKVVLVPTSDHQKEVSLSIIVQKLVTQLKRIRDRNRIDLQLDDQIMRLFFKNGQLELDSTKLEQYQKHLRQKHSSLGSWTDSYPFMINSFLQDNFTLKTQIEETNKVNDILKLKLFNLEQQIDNQSKQTINYSSYYYELLRSYNQILLFLRQNKQSLSSIDIQNLLTNYFVTQNQTDILARMKSLHQSNLNQASLNQSSLNQVRSSQRSSSVVQYKQNKYQTSQKQQNPALIAKIESLQTQKNNLNTQNIRYQQMIRSLQNQNKRLRGSTQSGISNSIGQVSSSINIKAIEDIKSKIGQQNDLRIKRLEQSHASSIQKLKAAQQKQLQRLRVQKSSTSNNDLINENRKLSDQVRSIKRDYQTQKRSFDGIKKQHQRQIQNLKKQYDSNLDKKEASIFSIETVKNKIAEQYERKIKQLKDAHQRQIQKVKAPTIKTTQIEVDREKQTNELRNTIKRLQIQLQITKKQIQIEQNQKSKLARTAVSGSIFNSGFKGMSQITQKVSPSSINEYAKIETYHSTIANKYDSPNNVDDRQQDQVSESSPKSQKQTKNRTQITLKQFMQMQQSEDKSFCSTFIIIKVIEKIQEEAQHGLLNSFTPSNIYLCNMNLKKIDSLEIRFGAPIISKNNKKDGLYLAPQILKGQKTTQKSVVFTLGVIWDELIHTSIYFKSMKEIQDPSNEFKVRDSKVNPILKNTLFEMMNKDSLKRIELHETKRRLSLQKYIVSESKR